MSLNHYPTCACRCRYKISTPGDREHIAVNLPRVMTELEMMLPMNWNSMVIHVLTFHTLDIIKNIGPYHTANILDIERFHTLFKSLARGKLNVMRSIANHYTLLEAALEARLNGQVDWTIQPRKSSAAGYASRLDSEDKTDRMSHPKGSFKLRDLTDEEFKQIQTLWADEYPEYHELHRAFNRVNTRRGRHKLKFISEWNIPSSRPNKEAEKRWEKMTRQVKVYLRVQYGGNIFRARNSKKSNRTDDTHVRLDYLPAEHRLGQQPVRKKAYARIKRLLVHAPFPGGKERVIVDGQWFEPMGVCLLANTTLVRKNKNYHFNHSSRFTFIHNCYTRPVAVWPHDPLDKLHSSNPRKQWMDVIDLNQEETV